MNDKQANRPSYPAKPPGSTIRTRAKKPVYRRDSMQQLYADIDAGYRYFWARRSGVPHLHLY